jgi:hypothetical protein
MSDTPRTDSCTHTVQYQTSLCTTGQSIPVVAADKCREIERELISAKAEVERLRDAVLLGGIKEGELREDAERYRWLRKGPIMTIQTDGVSKILLNPKFVPVMPGLSEKLDAAIDAARAALKEPK